MAANIESIGTLTYRKVQRTPQTGENAGKTLWYAVAVPGNEVSFEEFITHMQSHGSPFSRGTLRGVMLDALDHLQELILDGKSVRLSDLGLFSLGIKSRGEAKKADVNVDSIQDVHLIVRNTKSWSNKELYGQAKFKLMNSYGSTDDPDEGDNQGGTPGSGTGDNTGGGSKGDSGDSGTTPGGGGGSAEID